VDICADQFLCLSVGRDMERDLVFISHPKMHLDSSTLPLVSSFFSDKIFPLGTGSRGSVDRVMAQIASGIALLTQRGLSFMSKAILMESSI
jgi:hypothetical protein